MTERELALLLEQIYLYRDQWDESRIEIDKAEALICKYRAQVIDECLEDILAIPGSCGRLEGANTWVSKYVIKERLEDLKK
jgi:hypothetical protein